MYALQSVANISQLIGCWTETRTDSHRTLPAFTKLLLLQCQGNKLDQLQQRGEARHGSTMYRTRCKVRKTHQKGEPSRLKHRMRLAWECTASRWAAHRFFIDFASVSSPQILSRLCPMRSVGPSCIKACIHDCTLRRKCARWVEACRPHAIQYSLSHLWRACSRARH